MPRGDKSKYTDQQQRKAEHIEESYEERGVAPKEAEARAWATVNKQSGGGERKGGAGRKKSETARTRHTGPRRRAPAIRPIAARHASAAAQPARRSPR